MCVDTRVGCARARLDSSVPQYQQGWRRVGADRSGDPRAAAVTQIRIAAPVRLRQDTDGSDIAAWSSRGVFSRPRGPASVQSDAFRVQNWLSVEQDQPHLYGTRRKVRPKCRDTRTSLVGNDLERPALNQTCTAASLDTHRVLSGVMFLPMKTPLPRHSSPPCPRTTHSPDSRDS